MRRLPFVSSMCYLPFDILTIDEIVKLMRELTVVTYKKSDDGFSPAERVVIPCYDLSRAAYLGVPRAFGLERFKNITFVNKTISKPYDNRIKAACKIQPKNAEQRAFIEGIANVCKSSPIVDFIANARTGSGKTVSDLRVTADLGQPTLVIVPLNRLKDQWYGSLEYKNGIANFFGSEWAKRFVGFVQQDICDYKGKLIVIGLIHSLASRDYGREFYEYFGKITIDEVHTAAAPKLSRVLMKFPAAIRGGYTATNKNNELRKICDFHFGKPKVVSAQDVMIPNVFIIVFDRIKRFFAMNDNHCVSQIGKVYKRNVFLSNLIYHKGWLRGRHVIGLSDRIEQLEDIKALLIHEHGIPAEQIGLHVGQVYDEEKGRKVKVPKAELERIIRECRIILATYAIFQLGMDVPRLDMGIELTPRADVTQAVGRVTRFFPDKPTPEWYSMNDVLVDECGEPLPARDDPKDRSFDPVSFFSCRMAARRMCYNKQKAKISMIRSRAA